MPPCEILIKRYPGKFEADQDSYIMREQGYTWHTGWTTTKGYSVEYWRKYKD